MKKIYNSLFCLLLSFVFLTGCNETKVKPESETNSITSSVTEVSTEPATQTQTKDESINFTLVRHWSDEERKTAYYPTAKNIVVDDYYDVVKSDIDYLDVYHDDIIDSNSLTETRPVNAECVVLNNNKPIFSIDFIDTLVDDAQTYEYYSDLDDLSRCGTTYAVICKEIMPTEKRGDIDSVKPSGWQTAKYDKSVVTDMYLYNRCHLIGYQLAGENANNKNLITGTRFMNIVGMLPFENQIADYMDENPNNHVLYQVTPVFEADNLVSYGVIMSALSCEDYGEGVRFCVFCPNVQPKIGIDYSNGENWLDSSNDWYTGEIKSFIHDDSEYGHQTELRPTNAVDSDYILNENSKKYHLPSCEAADKIAEDNKTFYNGNAEDLESQGYEPCKICIH